MKIEAQVRKFRRAVWSHYCAEGRHDLPWRKTQDPYHILVSEVMLQQTQVPRVIEKFAEFLGAFPDVSVLAAAPLSRVLSVWNGMGYNRRAKFLQESAGMIAREHTSMVPSAYGDLRALPGVGDYTARAVRVFAFNEPDVLVETNVRAAIIHHFFHNKTAVSDELVKGVAELAAFGQDPRLWHSALMDYGSHLKKIHTNPTRKSAQYVVPMKFKGSRRQVRGAILRLLNEGSHGDLALSKKLAFKQKIIREALTGLLRDGLVTAERGTWRIA